jgi:hypothetical protein
MTGDIFHIPALGEQSVEITKNGISDYFRYSVPAEADHVGDFLMDPSQTMEPEDAGISPYSLSGPDIRDPFIDGLLDDP